MEAIQTPFNAAQQELLQLFAIGLSDEELRDIKRMLVKYFMERAMDEADKVWDKRGYTNELMEEWRQTKRSEQLASV